MKTLNTIQTLAKIGKILSKIAFILTLVGVCLCAAGLILLPLGGGEIFKIGGVTIHGLLGVEAEEGVKIAAVALGGALVVCIGEAVLAKYSERYFANELSAGTPFTLAGAKELKRLGILTLALPLGSSIVSEIVQAIVAGVLNVAKEQADFSFEPDAAITRGVLFLVMALLCRYGAERTNEQSGGEPQTIVEQ